MLKNLVAPPRLEIDELEARDLAAFPLAAEDVLERAHCTGSAVGDGSRSRWSEAYFDRCRLNAVPWTAAHWQDVRFEECDLANVTAAGAYGARVEFLGCRLLGFSAPESSWYDILWRDCSANLVHFRYAKFVRVRFENCDFKDADFQNCDLRGAVFHNCKLEGAQFSFCQLDKADWRGSDVTGLRVNAASLKGVVVTPFQAACFGKLLGLRVSWTDGEANGAAGGKTGPVGDDPAGSPGKGSGA